MNKSDWVYRESTGWWEMYIPPDVNSGRYQALIYAWCWDTFGQIGFQWENHGTLWKLRNEEDITWFILKWGK